MDEDGDMQELAQLREEARALKRLSEAMGRPDFAWQVFNKVFVQDIERLLSMEDMWKNRRPPTVLNYNGLAAGALDSPDDQSPPSATAALAMFRSSAERLACRATQRSERTLLAFDKDDRDALEFVAAAANLRAYAFGIPPTSVFAVKAMAGNIIPAIATTNAIVAGMMALQAVNVVDHRLQDCFTVYLTYSSSHDRYYMKERLPPPNPRCSVCRRHYLTMRLADPARTTLADLLAHVMDGIGTSQDMRLGEGVSIVEGSRILYDPDFDDNAS
ncbi:E1 ubiquitin-activating protein uba2, partial [Linderina pennispora]